MYPIERYNNRTLYVGNTKFTSGRPKIANFNSAKTSKIPNAQTLISANISSFTVYNLLILEHHLHYKIHVVRLSLVEESFVVQPELCFFSCLTV